MFSINLLIKRFSGPLNPDRYRDVGLAIRHTEDAMEYHNLTKRLVEELKIPCIGPSRHFISNPNGNEEFYPDRIWTIKVMPSFDNYGLIAVFEGRTKVRCAVICKTNLQSNDFIVFNYLQPRDDWNDPVLPIIRKTNIAPEPDRSLPDGTFMQTMDGISYVFNVETHESRSQIAFSNPKSDIFLALQNACYSAAEEITKKINQPEVTSFTATWKSYITE